MGCDFYVNVGPVVVIKNPPVATTETHNCCCNDNCKKFHQTSYDKFCTECGAKITEWVESVTKPLHIDFYELFKERLIPDSSQNSADKVIILIPNKTDDCKAVNFQHFNLKYEPFLVFPNIEEIGSYVKKFEEVFEKELNKLKEIFGETNVSVRYGTVGTISC